MTSQKVNSFINLICTKESQFRRFYYSIGLVQSTLFSIFADAKHTDLNYGTIVENH